MNIHYLYLYYPYSRIIMYPWKWLYGIHDIKGRRQKRLWTAGERGRMVNNGK